MGIGFGLDAGVCVCANDVVHGAPSEEYLVEVPVRERCVGIASIGSRLAGDLFAFPVVESESDAVFAELYRHRAVIASVG